RRQRRFPVPGGTGRGVALANARDNPHTPFLSPRQRSIQFHRISRDPIKLPRTKIADCIDPTRDRFPAGPLMILDMPTVTLVSFAATAILGLVLCLLWWQERSSELIGWWGVAQLVMASGIAFASAASFSVNAPLLAFGQALMVLAAAIVWMAVREFEGRK